MPYPNLFAPEFNRLLGLMRRFDQQGQPQTLESRIAAYDALGPNSRELNLIQLQAYWKYRQEILEDMTIP